MGFPHHPLRPWSSALRAVWTAGRSPVPWAPFVGLAAAKALLLVAVARVDLLPAVVLEPCLQYLPGLERHLHYPDVMLRLPLLAGAWDVVVFSTVGAAVQGWAILRLARSWAVQTTQPFGNLRRTFATLRALTAVAVLQLVVPFAAVRVAVATGAADVASAVGFVTGGVAATLLFVAPAFVVLHGLGTRACIASSIRLILRLPLALPLAVVAVAVLHAPALLLRAPVIRAGAASDPDWILWALLSQLPAEVVGAVFSAGLAAYFASRTQTRRRPTYAARSPLATTATVAILALLGGSGCDDKPAADLKLRYECERGVERARLRELGLVDAPAPGDSTAWLEVAGRYGTALERLGSDRLARSAKGGIDHDLGRLTCKALLGRAGAWVEAGRTEPARRDYQVLLAAGVTYRGAAGDAALGLARAADRARRWDVAYADYILWMEGVRDGTWPLHRNGMPIAPYVARRLRDRGEVATRSQWIDLAATALEAAAARDELAREARYARFGVLLADERWNDAYETLRVLRRRHDPEGHDGGLLVAEASLLAGGLGREHQALGLLAGLNAEKSPYDSEHRVAGLLLLGQILVRNDDLDGAARAYQAAGAQARSESGRAEATLGLARVHAARDEVDEARRYFTQLRQAYAATPAGLLAPLEEIRLLQRRGDEVEVRAFLPVAIHTYRSVISQFGTERPALLAARCMSECMGLAGHWDHGVAFLDSISTTFGNDPRAGSLLVRAARLAVERLDDRPRAQQILGRVQTRLPNSDVAVLARSYEDSLALHAGMP